MKNKPKLEKLEERTLPALAVILTVNGFLYVNLTPGCVDVGTLTGGADAYATSRTSPRSPLPVSGNLFAPKFWMTSRGVSLMQAGNGLGLHQLSKSIYNHTQPPVGSGSLNIRGWNILRRSIPKIRSLI